MSDVKEKITEIVQSQPDDASYDEILRELAFEHMVQRGLKEAPEGQVVSNMVMEQQIRSWSK
jgi:predicted transcriptional regulator